VSGSAITQSQVVNLVSDLAGKANLAGGNAFTGAQTVTGTVGGSVPLIVTGTNPQTDNYLSIRRASDSTVLARVTNTGVVASIVSMWTPALQGSNGGGGSITLTNSAPVTVNPQTAAIAGLVVKGAASQTANLQEWQNSGGTVLASINSSGDITTSAAIFAGTSTWFTATANIRPLNANVIGAVIRGAASQTANLQEWQNSAGTVLARMTSAGVLRASQVLSLNGLSSMGEFNNGAIFEFVRATAASYSPGANRATIYFRDGTNAGTLKLVVRAGAAGAETTILDNIPQ
jgi:hypothetical protein